MKRIPYLPRRARWMVPGAIVAAAGGVLAGSTISAATAAPRLPARSVAQLLAAVKGGTQEPPLTGTITETVSLGLPALPQVGLPGFSASLTSLLAGSHTFEVWYSDPEHYRLALPHSMSEEDLVRNGTSAWLWDSSANSVTRITLPATPPAPPVPSAPLTPQQAARRALASIGPSTTVRVDTNMTVAGQAAYQLVLAPRSHSSLVGQVRIAIDSQHRVPLRVEVFAKGATSPAAETGFTAISFTRPSSSDYAFTPPAGAKVAQEHIGAAGLASADRQGRGVASGSAASGGVASGGVASGVRVIGTGWLAVADLPQSSLASLTGAALPGSPGGSDLLPFRHSSSVRAPGSADTGGRKGPDGPVAGGALGPIFGALLNSARHVSGSWGSGRLLRTSLVSILLTSNGRVLVGAVTPDVLYHAAMQAGHAPAGLWRHTASRAGPK
jgi:outer membrane lipoprotein-sorting protein